MNRIIVVAFSVAALAAGTTFAQMNNAPAAAPAAPAAPAAAAAAPAYGTNPVIAALRANWEQTRSKVIGIAAAFPDDKMDWRPTPNMPEVRTTAAMIAHLAGENYSFFGQLSGDTNRPSQASLDALKTKAELVAALTESYNWAAMKFDALTEASAMEVVPGRGGRGGSVRLNSVISAINDNMDHYGNLVVYLRLNGVVPPTTAARAAGRGPGGGGGGAGGARGGAPGGAAPAAAPAPRGM